MNWLLARLREPSTWSALSSALMALGIYLFTTKPWWRDLLYLSAVCSVVAAILKEKGGT